MPDEISWPWSVLGLENQPENARDIKRAYARCLKGIDQTKDIQAFEALRRAYEYALNVSEGNNGRRNVTQIIAQEAQKQRIATSSKSPSLSVETEARLIDDAVDCPADQKPIAQEAQKQRIATSSKPPSLSVETETRLIDDAVDCPADQKPKETKPWSAGLDYSDPSAVLAEAHRLVENLSVQPTAWRKIFNAPCLADPYMSSKIQRILVDFLSGDKTLSADPIAIFVAIEERFGWVADGIGFLKRFPGERARVLQSEMAWSLREYASSHPDAAPSGQAEANWQEVGHGKSLSPWLWVATIFAWIFAAGALVGNW